MRIPGRLALLAAVSALTGAIVGDTQAANFRFTGLDLTMTNDATVRGPQNLSLDHRLVLGLAKYVHVAIRYETSGNRKETVACTALAPSGRGNVVRKELTFASGLSSTEFVATFGPFDKPGNVGAWRIECAAEGATAATAFTIDRMTTRELVKSVRPGIVLVRTLGVGSKPPAEVKGKETCRSAPLGGGTGFVIDPRGYILTNNHVIDPCPEDWPRPPLRVELEGGRKVVPTVVGQDPLTDLAVLKIDGTDLKPLMLEPDLVDVGEDVVAVGFPALIDGEPSATRGIISARGRNLAMQGDMIQTDAAINQGNSGGPLLDLLGRVVGVNTLTAVQTQNIGFAVSARVAQPVAEQLIRNGKVRRPDLGIRFASESEISETGAVVTEIGGSPFGVGLLIAAVVPGSPAATARRTEGSRTADLLQKNEPGATGLRYCDLLTMVGPSPIRGFGDFYNALLWLKPGTVEVQVRRYPPEKCQAFDPATIQKNIEAGIKPSPPSATGAQKIAPGSSGEVMRFVLTLP